MYENMNSSFRADYYKVVPDFSKVQNEVINPQADKVRNGEVDAPSIAAELEKKANETLMQSKEAFEKELKELNN